MNHTASSNILKSVIMGSFFMVTTSVFYSAPAQAYQCKPAYRIGVAYAKKKRKAWRKAKKRWSASTKSTYGVAWSLWGIANPTSKQCSKQGNRWRCAAYAKPCLYVVP